MDVSRWIAKRYLFSRQQHRFLPLLTATSIAGIAIGILALVVVLSVMKGFNRELVDRLLGFNAHLTIRAESGAALARSDVEQLLVGVPVRDLAPIVEGEGIAQHRSGDEVAAHGVRVRGMEGKQDHSGAVLGSEVANDLLVHPDFGQEIELVAPIATVGPTGELVPHVERYAVKEIFRAGVYEIDGKYVLLSLAEARRLLGLQAREAWQVRLVDPHRAPSVVKELRQRAPVSWIISSWNEDNQKLFAALKLERVTMGAILSLIVLIASCSIAGCIILLMSLKRRDMALLSALGLTERATQRIFIVHAAWIGAVGASLGALVGSLICFALQRKPIALPASYYLDHLPVEPSLALTLGFAAAGVCVAILASLYPVLRVSHEEVHDVLRYE